MFLAPSSSRAVDPYLQTLLLRVSLSRLGGKHRHRLSSNAQASTSGNYEANFARMKAELNRLLGTKLSQFGINPSKNQLYQRLYPDALDLVPYPTGWHVPDFVKFSGDDNRSTWEHINQYVAQLGEASSSNALRVRLFSLSLTGTALSWFSSLSPNSVRSWNELEQKFHDHFYSWGMKLN